MSIAYVSATIDAGIDAVRSVLRDFHGMYAEFIDDLRKHLAGRPA